MRKFTQIVYNERDKIYRGLCEGKSQRKIAKIIGKNVSNISREIKRNSDHIGYLYPGKAHEKTIQRKNRNKPKISKNENLKTYVIGKLKKRWSPKVIAGRYKMENPGQKISAETIYTWIYSDEGEALGLKKLLVRAHKKRGLKRRIPKSKIKNRISIHERPEVINTRDQAGHFECDLIFNSGSQSKNICTLIDRVTRQSILIKNESKHTTTVIDAIVYHIKKYRPKIVSITFDNGSEFAGHERLHEFGIKTYFCDPGAPWQKGSIEHLNGMIRRFVPFDMPSHSITDDLVKYVNREINNMPRAILGFKTPIEVLRSSVMSSL